MEPKGHEARAVIAGPWTAIRRARRRRMRGRFSGGSPWTTDRTCPRYRPRGTILEATRRRGRCARRLGPALQSAGGIDGLMEKLRGGGLGSQVDSWVSPGPNEPVDPQLLGQALGPETTPKMSSQTGLDIGQLLPLLAAVLPQLVNMLTPDGRVPEGGLDQAAGGMPDLGGLLGGLLGGSGGSGGRVPASSRRARWARRDAGRHTRELTAAEPAGGRRARRAQRPVAIPSADGRRRRVSGTDHCRMSMPTT